MRTPRISRDATTRLLDQVAPPRRSTRSHTRLAPASAAVVCPPRDIEDAVVAPPPAKRRRKAEPPPADASTATAIAATAPSGWEEIYVLVRRMRAPGGAAHGAPVDTMGCERLADPTVSARDRRFHTLVALMLSSQTKDTVNAVAMRRLQTELPPHRPGAPAGLNLANVLAVEPETLNQLIWAVGFHNNKTKYIKKAAEVLRDQWAGDIPDTIEGLTALPGVGPKMGYLCLSAAWGRTEGIGVDVHVHRITNLWGWHRTRIPEETRRALQAWLPRDRWHEINTLLVGLGQAVCVPAAPRCGSCDLGLEGLCRAADRKKVRLGREARRGEGGNRALKNEGEVEMKIALGESKEEMEEIVKNESVNGDVAFKDGNEAEDEVKNKVKSEVRNEVKYNPKDDTEGEELEVKVQVEQYGKDELEGNVGQIKGEVKGEINIKDECHQSKEEDYMVKEESKVKDEITVMDIGYEVEDQGYGELKQEFKREFKHEIKQES